jgi:hypothetical protein
MQVIYDDNDPHAGLYDVDDGMMYLSRSFSNYQRNTRCRVYRDHGVGLVSLASSDCGPPLT